MASSILIMGESGTGKSHSLKNLNPNETYIISVIDKPLPFKGSIKKYCREKRNYLASDNVQEILRTIENIDKHSQAAHIKVVVIDDFQYVMGNEFMRKARERGFEKFVEIGQGAWSIINRCSKARDDLCFFILSHTETDSNSGKVKCKTIGKMLDDKITLEGMFTVVLHSMVIDNKYYFLTQNDGIHIAKSPVGMFDKHLIDNDAAYVQSQMIDYLSQDEEHIQK